MGGSQAWGATSTPLAMGPPWATLSFVYCQSPYFRFQWAPALKHSYSAEVAPPLQTLVFSSVKWEHEPLPPVVGRTEIILEGTGVTKVPDPDSQEVSALWAAWLTRSAGAYRRKRPRGH